MTISSQGFFHAAWSFLSQKHDFLNYHLMLVSFTRNREGTKEMRDEVLSSAGAQDRDTSRYQVSDLEDVDFYWEMISWM